MEESMNDAVREDAILSRATRRAVCLDCGEQIEQDNASGIWLPFRCADCDAKVEAKAKAILQADKEALARFETREMIARTNLRADIVDGRLTLERLPELYAESRIQGGVYTERYREIVQLVKDFISVPPLLRASNTACILLLHGPKGVGKSWLLEVAVGYTVRCLKQSARFITPPEMWAALKADDETALSEQYVRNELTSLALLGIDDLRRKKQPTAWEIQELLNVIDKRLRFNRPTLLTCSLNTSELHAAWCEDADADRKELVGELIDRLSDRKRALSIAMGGTSLRRERA